MSAADYTIQGSGPITLRAKLASGVTQGQTTWPLTDLFNQLVTPAAGMGVMIDDEICRVVSSTSDTLTVARGCADTIPALHNANSLIWFFDDAVGTDNIEYSAGETIGVKVLMHTETREMGINDAPPNQLAFVGRFAKPYPPGRVRANTAPWYNSNTTPIALGGSGAATLALTWAHRNRVTQADQLIDHEATDVTPEVGQTYSIVVHRANGTIVRTITGITANNYAYSATDAWTDVGPYVTPGVPVPGYLMLYSMRDGLRSYQGYRIDFTASQGGWGTGWGSSWGG